MSFIKKLVFKVLSRRVIIPSSGRIIFVYHDISDRDSKQYSDFYSTDKAIFKKQIEFIKNNFEIVSIDEILLPNDSKKRLAAITFDDGFLSVKNVAMEFLSDQKIPFTIFVNKTAINENFFPCDQFDELNQKYDERIYLNADEIKDLHEKGITIGSHSASHKTMTNCNEKMLYEQVVENKEFLEKLIGKEVLHFAIPYGKREHYNEESINYCRSAGHKYIYSTNPVFFTEAWNKDEAKPIPRIGLTNQTVEELCFLINRPLLKKIDI